MTEILLYLYIYSFIGWVYESTYVSIKKKHWVNRGFMHGPFLTIYGFGGILCVAIGTATEGDPINTFIFAVLICTAMELATGLTMEKMFKVRYWDYSEIKFNIKGYVCPPVSLFWGILALLVNRYVHVYIAASLATVNSQYLQAVTYILTIVCAVDFTMAFNEAVDLRNMLEEIRKGNDSIRELREKMDGVKEIIQLDSTRFKEFGIEFRDNINETQQSMDVMLEEYYNNQREAIENIKSRIKTLPDAKERLQELRLSLNDMQVKFRLRKYHSTRGIRRIMDRNPSMNSLQYKEILEILKKLGE